MRQVARSVLLVWLVGAGLIGGCGWSGYKFANDFLHNSLSLQSFDSQLFRWCFNGLPFVDQLDSLFAHRTYLILLQNNRELRPSGGFMGSYAQVNLQPTGLASVAIQDIYVPDGQIAGHVDPPRPIQQAFGQGGWKLRDSNWDPDFTVAAPQIAWFFGQGGEEADGLVAVNLSLVSALLQVLGEVKASDYPETISSQTFYDLAQEYAEVGFFPGSTQKRDFLGAVGTALVKRIIISTPLEKLKLTQLVWRQLQQGEILIWFADEALQATLKQRGWDGSLGEYTHDYLYLVETNLGANKANCCIVRQVVQEVTDSNTKLTVTYRNDNVFADPNPPHFWGGNYINYLRLVFPSTAEISSVKVGDKQLVERPLDNQYGLQEDRYQVEDRDKFKTIGLWAVVPTQTSTTVEINYNLRFTSDDDHSVLVKHQPGQGELTYRLISGGREIVNEGLLTDKVYNAN